MNFRKHSDFHAGSEGRDDLGEEAEAAGADRRGAAPHEREGGGHPQQPRQRHRRHAGPHRADGGAAAAARRAHHRAERPHEGAAQVSMH